MNITVVVAELRACYKRSSGIESAGNEIHGQRNPPVDSDP